jgi:hypothetical protein
MAVTSYESVLHLAESLSHEDQLRLIQELMSHTGEHTTGLDKTSVLTLHGLGAEIWKDIDAQEYVSRERSSWQS